MSFLFPAPHTHTRALLLLSGWVQEAVAIRNKLLEDLVQEATTRPPPGATASSIKRIDLREAGGWLALCSLGSLAGDEKDGQGWGRAVLARRGCRSCGFTLFPCAVVAAAAPLLRISRSALPPDASCPAGVLPGGSFTVAAASQAAPAPAAAAATAAA
jgi:hypothetical protein